MMQRLLIDFKVTLYMLRDRMMRIVFSVCTLIATLSERLSFHTQKTALVSAVFKMIFPKWCRTVISLLWRTLDFRYEH
jgi:hypothetical protein